MDSLLPETKERISCKYADILKGPFQVAFDITNKCNFRCLHCYNNSGENHLIDKELNDNEAICFAKDIRDLKLQNFCFCGGEPLLRFDLMCKMTKILSSATSKISVVSNASLFSREKAEKLESCGLKYVQFSLDGGTAQSYMKLRPHEGAFEKVLKSIVIAKHSGIDVSVSFIPTKYNVNELDDIVHMLIEQGVKALRLQPLMKMGRAKENISTIIPSKFQYRELIRFIYELQNKHRGQIDIQWGDPVDHLIRFRTRNQHLVTSAIVLSDGSIAVSPYLPFVVGNVRKHPFSAYWDAGLAKVWELPFIQTYAKEILSVDNMENSQIWGEVSSDTCFGYDLIEDSFFPQEGR